MSILVFLIVCWPNLRCCLCTRSNAVMELPAAIPAEPSWADKVGDFPLGPRAISLAELHGADDLVGSEPER